MNGVVSSLAGWVRRRRHPFVWAYTFMFAVTALVCLWPFIAAGRHLMWDIDGLQAHYVRFTVFGRWVRQIVRETMNAGTPVVPQWDLCLGYGGDLVVYLGNYVGNPFTYISIILPGHLSEYGFDLSFLLQFYAAGLSFGFFARERGLSRFQMLAGSIVYVFSGWMLVCVKQFIFIYITVLFPLLLAGAERVFRRQSPTLFVGTVAALFLYYFYFAYMACLLLMVYCVVLYAKYERRRGIRTFLAWVLRFVVYGLVGVLISCVLLVPALMGLVGQTRLGLDRDVPLLYTIKQYADYLQGVLAYTYLDADSAISVGALAIVCIALMFMRRGRGSLKVLLLILTSIALVPAAGSVLNGFQYASNRWMWAAVLCVAYIVAEMLPELSSVTPREVRWLLCIAIVLGVLLSLRPDGMTPLKSPMLRTALCGLLAVIGMVGCASWARSTGRMPNIDTQRLIACAGVVLITWIPFHYVLSEHYLSERVAVGRAWGAYNDQASLNAARSTGDDSVWRWDYAGIDPLRNTGIMGQVASFDAYANIYDQGVDSFARGVETSSSQSFQTVSTLCSRSFLESALGAKYFVIGAKAVGTDDVAINEDALLQEGESSEGMSEEDLQYVPRNEELPFGVDPVDDSETTPDWMAYASKNELALPLAYTHSRVITLSDYASLTAAQKQQALLQAVALEDTDEPIVANVDSSTLVFDDATIPYDMKGSKKVRVEDGKIVTSAKKKSVTLTLKDRVIGETYVEFVGLTYENVHPELPEQPTREELMRYLTRSFSWKHVDDYTIVVESDDGRRQSLGNCTRYSHMYAADNNNIINLGLLKKCPSTISLIFDRMGVYTFEAINVIVQPMDNLERFVEERRTYPVELSMDTNAFTASVANAEPQVLFLSIPCSRGWSATVDDKPVEIMKAYGAFMAMNLSAGQHVVKLSYATPGLRLGIALSAIGIALAVVVARRWKR